MGTASPFKLRYPVLLTSSVSSLASQESLRLKQDVYDSGVVVRRPV